MTVLGADGTLTVSGNRTRLPRGHHAQLGQPQHQRLRRPGSYKAVGINGTTLNVSLTVLLKPPGTETA
ncbi:MAG: hypothetical protein ACLT8E_09180 [Akkermansia sp.]